jgi:hypothetical protein
MSLNDNEAYIDIVSRPLMSDCERSRYCADGRDLGRISQLRRGNHGMILLGTKWRSGNEPISVLSCQL